MNAAPRYRVAAFATAGGALDPTFKPAVSSRVRALAVGTRSIFLGGGFTTVDAAVHNRLAAVDPAGKLYPPSPPRPTRTSGARRCPPAVTGS